MNEMNSLAFMMQGGAVTLGVALVLLVMSVLSWYFMLTKTRQVLQMKAKMKADAAAFWAAPNLEAAIRDADSVSPRASPVATGICGSTTSSSARCVVFKPKLYF